MVLKVKEINYGIACRIEDKIYINKAIRKYPLLYKSIITHEKEHTNSYRPIDFWTDISIDDIAKEDYWYFVIFNPSSWTEFLPIGIYDGKAAININLIVIYTLSLIGLIVLWILKT